MQLLKDSTASAEFLAAFRLTPHEWPVELVVLSLADDVSDNKTLGLRLVSEKPVAKRNLFDERCTTCRVSPAAVSSNSLKWCRMCLWCADSTRWNLFDERRCASHRRQFRLAPDRFLGAIFDQRRNGGCVTRLNLFDER